jgi:hypothetical protein
MQEIQVLGRRWFQRTYGNTYHVADIWVTFADGSEHKLFAEYAYGYGEQYLETALKTLADAGLAQTQQTQYGRETMRQYCERNGIALDYRALDVTRKRDLRGHSLVL